MPKTSTLSQAPTPTGRMVWNLDWNLIRTFLVIVEEAGITAAANRLGLKQPTVSNALRRLEDRLGKRLVVRGPGKFEVTPAGMLLYDEAVEIFGSISRLGILIRDMDEEVSGHVTLALASHVVSPVLDEVLSTFHQRHPKATLGIEVLTSRDVIQAVRQRQASIGICLVHEKRAQLDYLRLFREYFGFFCGPHHRLFGKRGLNLTDLRGETSVSFKTDRLTDALRPVALIRAEAQLDDRVVGVSSNLEEVRRMIVAGLGIGPLPIHVAARDVEAGLLWRLPPYETPPAIDIYVVSNPHTRFNRAEQSLLSMLKNRIAEVPFAERDYR
ncbi:LysR family transcriptional regulator [Nitratireductor sp. GCM10026969]|uniref:LysR family transcriptional regulator n=1 Tax=Nitratireductor sp. GCM10026969 TaxID=3252645 RepID=UPI00360618C7